MSIQHQEPPMSISPPEISAPASVHAGPNGAARQLQQTGARWTALETAYFRAVWRGPDGKSSTYRVYCSTAFKRHNSETVLFFSAGPFFDLFPDLTPMFSRHGQRRSLRTRSVQHALRHMYKGGAETARHV